MKGQTPAPPSAADTVQSYSIPVDGRVYAVDVCQFAWASNLVVYGTASAVGVIKITLPEDSECGTLKYDVLHVFHHDSRVRSLSWSPDSNLSVTPQCVKFAAAGSDHCVRLYHHTGRPDPDNQPKVHVLRGHTDYVNEVACSPDGRMVASVGDDLTCRLWDAAAEGAPLACLPLDSPGVSVGWHAEEPLKLLLATRSGAVTMYNTESQLPVFALHTRLVGLAAAAWSPADSLKVAALAESSLVLMDVTRLSAREAEQEVHPAGGGQQVRFSHTATQHLATSSLTQVRVTQLGVKQAPLVADLMAVGGISWHSALPYLLAGTDRKLMVWRVNVI